MKNQLSCLPEHIPLRLGTRSFLNAPPILSVLRLIINSKTTVRPLYKIRYRNQSWLTRNDLGDVLLYMKNQLSCLPEHIPLRLDTRSFLNAPRNERIAFNYYFKDYCQAII